MWSQGEGSQSPLSHQQVQSQYSSCTCAWYAAESREKSIHFEREIKQPFPHISMWRFGIVSDFDGLEAKGPFHPEVATVW